MLKAIFCRVVIIWSVLLYLSCSSTRVIKFNDHEKQAQFEKIQSQLKKNPNDVDEHMNLGNLFYSEQMIKESILEYQKVLSIDSIYIPAFLRLVLALEKYPQPDLYRITKLLEKAERISPDNPFIHLRLAHTYIKSNNDDGAITEFSKVIDLTDDAALTVSAHLGLMAVYQKQGDTVNVQSEYRKASQIYPDVDQIIKQAEINKVMPPPRYAGDELGGEDELHPSLEERIRRLNEEIRRLEENNK